MGYHRNHIAGTIIAIIICIAAIFLINIASRHNSRVPHTPQNDIEAYREDSIRQDSIANARILRAIHKASRDSAREAKKKNSRPTPRDYLNEHVPAE